MSAAERARLAWLTASRDTELERWREMYDLLVPRPAGPVDDRPGGGNPAGCESGPARPVLSAGIMARRAAS